MTDEAPASGPTIMLFAGEPSGDRHGAEVVRALRERLPHARLTGLGGDEMAAAGMELLYNLPHQLAIMGIVAVLARLPRIGRLLHLVRRHIDREPPDLVVLIDYPGFNLQVAELASRRGVKVAFYITPQVWAWAPWRIRRLARITDQLLVIFPFEETLFRERGVDARFVGHPLTEQLADFEQTFEAPVDDPPLLGLLPGSRSQEIRGVLPVMLDSARHLQQTLTPTPRIALAAAKPKHRPLIDRLVARSGLDVEVLEGQAHALIKRARLVLVTSGTATLETALLGTPMMILYRISHLSLAIVRATPLLTTDHFGLANIVAGARVVPELLFAGNPSARIAETAAPLWSDGPERQRALEGLARVRQVLHRDRPASEVVAESLLELLPHAG